ncbi:MAG TPA: signal peptidase I [Gemmatimonadaceae bacterium]|nr:signal peptidase I [Gemmatimonadaceae bacterium]
MTGLLAIGLGISILQAVAVSTHRVVSGSMMPTLEIGDWVVVNRLRFGPFAYGARFGILRNTPLRGELVVFVRPMSELFAAMEDVGERSEDLLVKRVVGVSGDTILMRNGRLCVNGVTPGFEQHISHPHLSTDRASPFFAWQRQFAVSTSRFGTAPSEPTLDNWGPFVVPSGRIFVLGDNRYHSTDSRYFGFVELDELRGEPELVYFSVKPPGLSGSFVERVRWRRVGALLN